MPEVSIVSHQPGQEFVPPPAADYADMLFEVTREHKDMEEELTPDQVRQLEFQSNASSGPNFASASGMRYALNMGEVCRFNGTRHTQVGKHCPHGIGDEMRAKHGELEVHESPVPPVSHWKRVGS